MKRQAQAQTVVLPEVATEQELSLLKGFRDLVREGLGYYFGAKSLRGEATEKCKEERKEVSKFNKNIRLHLEEVQPLSQLDEIIILFF